MALTMSSTQKEFLTREEAASHLGLKPQTLAKWASTGRMDLPFTKVGRSVRYRYADLQAWLAKNTATQTPVQEER